ncbi:MAG: hypothetical protein LBK03_00140 [Bacteroidales bacterium]|nr:hypothetical protein [Bacteroidales bacterium]
MYCTIGESEYRSRDAVFGHFKPHGSTVSKCAPQPRISVCSFLVNICSFWDFKSSFRATSCRFPANTCRFRMEQRATEAHLYARYSNSHGKEGPEGPAESVIIN